MTPCYGCTHSAKLNSHQSGPNTENLFTCGDNIKSTNTNNNINTDSANIKSTNANNFSFIKTFCEAIIKSACDEIINEAIYTDSAKSICIDNIKSTNYINIPKSICNDTIKNKFMRIVLKAFAMIK